MGRGTGQANTGECGGWYAWRDNEPSGVAALKVTRECEFPTPGYPSSPAIQFCIGAYVRFARLTAPDFFPPRRLPQARRKESRQSVSNLYLVPSSNHQQFIADSSRSLRCTHEQEPPPSKCGNEVLGECKKDARQER